jgi:hypothetical protein
VRRILNLASSEWRDEKGLTWREHAPKITLLRVRDSRPAYPLSREEQDMLFIARTSSPMHRRYGKAKPGEVQEIPVTPPIEKMHTTAWKNARSNAADIWEREQGQPAPDGFRRARSTWLRRKTADKLVFYWRARRDSNPRPPA